MTTRVDVAGIRFVTIQAESNRICQQCGKVAETRPYGKGGMRICFECGRKDVKETERQMGIYLFGDKE
jgi:hypothetical protein